MRSMAKSQELQARAEGNFPGGVNSPVRAFRAVGGHPPFVARAEGAYLFDADGNRYVDLFGSWGPMILGHAFPPVVEAIREAAGRGASFGASHADEANLAELVRRCFPSVEKMRFVSSGTEACMSAIRLARGFTGRNFVVKFEGCYHGHADALLVKAGSGVARLGIADTQGVPRGFAETTIALPFNSIEAVEAAFRERGSEIAAVIVEPVVGNMGCVPPAAGFLEALRDLTTKYGSLLIFDEVMTGFRLALGGAQQLFGIRPDLTTLGKIIGGGLPLAAYGGRADIMKKVAPVGPIYQAGTLSGNPMAVAAGIAVVKYLRANPGIYETLERRTAQLVAGAPAEVTVNRVGSMFTFFFTREPVTDWESAKRSDTGRFREFFHWMLDHGVYLAPSQFEAGFVSGAHSDGDIGRTVEVGKEFFE